MTDEPVTDEPATDKPVTGPHKPLLAVYAIFTVSAGARSGAQIVRDFDAAPVAYVLSVLAALTYALGWVAIRRAASGRLGFASVMLWLELAGVLGVGTLSVVRPDLFPDSSVWSEYGLGYGFVPAVLPVLGLLWLRRQRALRRAARPLDGSSSSTPRR